MLNPFTPNPFQQAPDYGGWISPAWVSNAPDTAAQAQEGPIPGRLPQEGRITLPGGRPAGISWSDLAHLQMLQQGAGQFPLQWEPAGDRPYRGPSDLGQFNPGESYSGARTNQPRLPGLGALAFLPPELVSAFQGTTAQASADIWNWLLQNAVPEFSDQMPSRGYAPIPAWLDR